MSGFFLALSAGSRKLVPIVPESCRQQDILVLAQCLFSDDEMAADRMNFFLQRRG